MARALMFQGTGSDVGKTALVAGLCRALTLRGHTVRPFKPQNMSNNAAVADDGGEIGRAQWLQALACGVVPSIHMNPVLLKPQSETGSQIVVHGKVQGSARGRDYQRLKAGFMEAVLHSFNHLSAQADFVLVEGAGSPAEINLRAGDIANMGFATQADVPVVLVGDIDRGGVIASLVGTHTILADADREMIVGYIINKFRGDVSLFDEGLTAIGGFTGWPCFGVVPWLDVIGRLPAEDSVALERIARRGSGSAVIAVPVTGRIANHDDLDPLAVEPGVQLVYVKDGEPFPTTADAIILPGSKSTLADLRQMRANGWDRAIIAAAARGVPVLGICGGYQMLGRTVSDPDGLEGAPETARGLGLLDVDTVMQPEKTTRNVTAFTVDGAVSFTGYEIHLGVTTGPDCVRPFCHVEGRVDGAVNATGNVQGTYMHGLFDSGAFRAQWLARMGVSSHASDHRNDVLDALDGLAARLEHHLDIDAMISLSR